MKRLAGAFAVLLAGCFVSTGGGLEADGVPDTFSDETGDTSEWTDPGLDGEGEMEEIPVDALDVTEGADTGPDPDDPVDPPPDLPPDVTPDPTDTVDEWECTVVYGDPACDDVNICTADWCDISTHTCVHSGASMQGSSCPDEGNMCTNDYCHGGVCVHSAYREGEFCTDDGNVCTADLCSGGACTHPGAPHDGDPCASDSEACTTDECSGGACAHPWISGCCHRDGDCIWVGHIWECNSSSTICYNPPSGEFCATCNNHTECGDGGSSSDDPCVWYTTSDHGCGKDCRSDYDCPRGSRCVNGSGGTCSTTDTECFCQVRVGTCHTWRHFGDSCSTDPDCDGPSTVCRSGHCTWACTTVDDCPLESTGCTGGFCGV